MWKLFYLSCVHELFPHPVSIFERWGTQTLHVSTHVWEPPGPNAGLSIFWWISSRTLHTNRDAHYDTPPQNTYTSTTEYKHALYIITTGWKFENLFNLTDTPLRWISKRSMIVCCNWSIPIIYAIYFFLLSKFFH